MYRKLLTVLAALCMAVTVSVGLAGSASAGPLGLYRVTNNIAATTFNARCLDASARVYIRGNITYGTNTGSDDCNAFSVGDTRNVQYRSDATGAVYWSGCGRTLGHTNPTTSGYGWAYIGNSVTLIGKVAC